MISHLLELQGQGTDNKIARDAIAEGQSRVKSIALIHQRLYQNEDISTIEFKAFLDELYRQISSVFLSNTQKLDVQIEVPETLLDIDTAVPLGLIINELLTNAFKYAFEPEKKGWLQIKLSKGDELYKLELRDNGPGLPVERTLNSYDSLGMKLVGLLSKQLGGHTEYRTENGSVFTVYFKDVYARKRVL